MDNYKEIIEIVEKINGEVFEHLERFGLTYPFFELRTDGFSIIIIFMGYHRIWFSDEDEREFDEDKNEYEPLERYLRREAQKIIDQINGIKL